ncbi:MAG: single-stranded DNA-binding protein [Rhodospirillaceae bacterium]|nr:single-stranded DNA-binding protein [Rhodospirillaceae bacterium]
MLTVNRATLVGHAGRDPEIRELKGGNKAATFSLATSEKWTDREGKPAEDTQWHRVVVYGASVGIVETILRKGDPVMVEGRIATRKYQDREGNERSLTEIVVAGPQGMVNILAARRAEDGSATATGAAT